VELSLRPNLKLASDLDTGARQSRPLEKSSARIDSSVWIIGAALVALLLKLAIAYNTFGTNDVATFYMFARSLNDRGLEWTYRNGFVFFSNFPAFNHPPLTAYYLRGIYALTEQRWCQDIGIHFPFLLRLPGIIADFLVIVVLLRISRTDLRIPTWALALFALSPVSLMVSGFHGNTDAVMVMFLLTAAWMCLKRRPVWCGLFFALACQIKIIPLLLVPIVFFFWLARQAALRFAISFVLLSVTMWIQPLIKFPTLFLKNVLSYGSYWGGWGITYWLRLTHWRQFDGTGFFNLPPAAALVASFLKAGIVSAVLVIGWRRRCLCEGAVINSIAYAWIVFFVFSPGVCPQYMVWLAPFILILSPAFYGWITVTSSLFLFFLYNGLAGGLPWFIGISRNNLDGLNLLSPWSLWPWATLICGMILLWKKAVDADPSLLLFSFKPCRSQSHDIATAPPQNRRTAGNSLKR
jgi:hypothetical protein